MKPSWTAHGRQNAIRILEEGSAANVPCAGSHSLARIPGTANVDARWSYTFVLLVESNVLSAHLLIE